MKEGEEERGAEEASVFRRAKPVGLESDKQEERRVGRERGKKGRIE